MADAVRGDNIFAKIVRKEIPITPVYEDDYVLAFNDVNPQAPVHVLVVPKQDVENVLGLAASDAELAGHVLLAAAEVARRTGIDKTGFRVVLNAGAEGGQTVPHLHAHVLGGRPMAWPPG